MTLGYLDDPYTSLLYKPPRMHAGPSAIRKAPLINVGTHHRTAAIDLLVDKFLDQAGPNAQIVSLGAGSDTRYWRLRVSPSSICTIAARLIARTKIGRYAAMSR